MTASILAIAPVSFALAKSPPSSAGDWSSPGLSAPVDDTAPQFFKTENGVKVQVLSEGQGPPASDSDTVLIDFSLRRSNGYFIYSTMEGVSFQPSDVPIGPILLDLKNGNIIQGLREAISGMKKNGKRRVLVPPELGYINGDLQPQMPTFATKRQVENHKSEALLFEIERRR